MGPPGEGPFSRLRIFKKRYFLGIFVWETPLGGLEEGGHGQKWNQRTRFRGGRSHIATLYDQPLPSYGGKCKNFPQFSSPISRKRLVV